MILDYFSSCHVINLDRDTERLAKIGRQLDRLGIPFERYAAVDGLTLGLPADHLPARGHLACARSHANLYRQALDAGHEAVLIFEDDAIIRDDAADVMRSGIVPQLAAMEWDIFYLGCRLGRLDGRAGAHLARVKSAWHTHAYAVHRRALSRLIEWAESSAWHAEGWFDAFRLPGLVKLVAEPMLAVQLDGWSNTNEVVQRGAWHSYRDANRKDFTAHCAELKL